MHLVIFWRCAEIQKGLQIQLCSSETLPHGLSANRITIQKSTICMHAASVVKVDERKILCQKLKWNREEAVTYLIVLSQWSTEETENRSRLGYPPCDVKNRLFRQRLYWRMFVTVHRVHAANPFRLHMKMLAYSTAWPLLGIRTANDTWVVVVFASF